MASAVDITGTRRFIRLESQNHPMLRKEFVEGCRHSIKPSLIQFEAKELVGYVNGTEFEPVLVATQKSGNASWRFRLKKGEGNQWKSIKKIVYPALAKIHGW